MKTKYEKVGGYHLAARGEHRDQLYTRWMIIKQRCYNQNFVHYKNYGGRGITMCDEWLNSFVKFREWALKSGFKPGLSIDRIDNNKGYSPDNCRWATSSMQNRNRRSNRMITYNGKTQCLIAWSEETGINKSTIQARLRRGKSLDEVFDKKVRRSNRWQTK